MHWLTQLFTQHESVAYTAVIYALTIFSGAALGRLRIFGITFGVTLVLFTGIILSYLGFTINEHITHFVKEFGLILFVYTIGLQVGPGFFASFQREGLKLNALMLVVVLFDVLIVLAFYQMGSGDLPILVGIMQGAVTNTPGLGAAQQTLTNLVGDGSQAVQMAAGYAAAYPGGVMGLIAAIFLVKYGFRINVQAEKRLTLRRLRAGTASVTRIALQVENPMLVGKTVAAVRQILPTSFAVSRLARNGEITLADDSKHIQQGDILLVIARDDETDRLMTLIGGQVSTSIFSENPRTTSPAYINSMRVNVTQSGVCNKKLSSLNIHERYGVNISRVRRAGIEFVPDRNTRLQFGDSITLIGDDSHLRHAVSAFGNSKRDLQIPHIAELFLGITLGIVLGAIPIPIPGVPVPVKLGLAGGPLIVAILISRYGGRFSVTHYVSQSANLMVRELGLALFLASVGLSVGPAFFAALKDGDGLYWMALGIAITTVPLLITAITARLWGKLTFPEICGLLTGSHTGAPVLPFATEISQSDQTALKYAAVYPLTTFMRIMVGQVLIVLFYHAPVG
ncbi:putative transporter [uncultured Cardiobacterium sp.]|uniref:putative transporter n=1 Tax=uncultured Cardiobacterium sp. TaxID=417619 RepID=UPI0026265C72|nr:putative transporter [uncultured Cardiobacterium sp.]